MQDIPLACDLTVFTTEERRRHEGLTATLFGDPSAVRELPEGYAFPVPVTDLASVADFVMLERLCCPFLTFQLRVEPQSDIAWLEMGGNTDIKTLLGLEFNLS